MVECMFQPMERKIYHAKAKIICAGVSMTACFRTVLLSSFSLSLVDVNKQGVDDDVYDDYQC